MFSFTTAPGVCMQDWTRVDEGRTCYALLAKKTNARTVVGKGKKSLRSDPGSELRLEKEKEKEWQT